MKLQELIDFGFKHEKSSKNETGLETHTLSKLISFSKRPPFYINMVSIDATSGKLWRLETENIVICIVENIEQIKKAIFVISDFKYDSFN